jgi:hypothetical protein
MPLKYDAKNTQIIAYKGGKNKKSKNLLEVSTFFILILQDN